MGRPSDHWPGFDAMSPDTDKYKRIHHLISRANFEHLKTRAVKSRKRHQQSAPSDVECIINTTHFTSGFYNLVLELAFSDDVVWVARIPHQAFDDEDRISMLSEIATMRIVKEHTTIPIPQVFDFEASADQPFGYPYMLMECLNGRTLPKSVATDIPAEYHAKAVGQLANVFAELQNLTFSRIGRLWCGENADQPVEIMAMAWHPLPGPLDTSLEYWYNRRQSDNREAIAMHPGDADWLTASWVLKTALSHVIIEDRVRGPFPLCHLDLHSGNMLFDDEYNLTGIIDWSSAQAAPMEQLAVCPEFLTFPACTDDENRPMIELKKDVVEALREIETERRRGKRMPLNKLVAEADTALRPDLTPFSDYMASTTSELVTRLSMASPRRTLFSGKMVAELMYGNNVTWEQLREVYGTMPFF